MNIKDFFQINLIKMKYYNEIIAYMIKYEYNKNFSKWKGLKIGLKKKKD